MCHLLWSAMETYQVNEIQYLFSVDFLYNGLDIGKQTITVWKLKRLICRPVLGFGRQLIKISSSNVSSPGGSVVKNSPAIEGDRGDVSLTLVSGRSPGRIWQPVTVSLPGKSYGQVGSPWSQSWTQLSDWAATHNEMWDWAQKRIFNDSVEICKFGHVEIVRCRVMFTMI